MESFVGHVKNLVLITCHEIIKQYKENRRNTTNLEGTIGRYCPLNGFGGLGEEKDFVGKDELRIVYVEFEGLICFPMKTSNM